MDVGQERRSCEDRRAFAVYYRYGNERRNNTENRRYQAAEIEAAKRTESLLPAHLGGDSNDEVFKAIADAFGVPVADLEPVDHDDLLDTTEYCPSCADVEDRLADLEAKLAASQQSEDRYRKQVRELLLSFNSRLQ